MIYSIDFILYVYNNNVDYCVILIKLLLGIIIESVEPLIMFDRQQWDRYV